VCAERALVQFLVRAPVGGLGRLWGVVEGVLSLVKLG